MKARYITLSAAILLIILIGVFLLPRPVPSHPEAVPQSGRSTQKPLDPTAPTAEASKVEAQRFPPAPARQPEPAASPTQPSKLTMLLQAVHSREAALTYLDGWLDQFAAGSADVPKIKIVKEDEMPPEQKVEYLEARASAAKKDQILIVTRDDSLPNFHWHYLSLYPAQFIPAQVREFLSDTDIYAFQNSVAVTQLEKAAVRSNTRR